MRSSLPPLALLLCLPALLAAPALACNSSAGDTDTDTASSTPSTSEQSTVDTASATGDGDTTAATGTTDSPGSTGTTSPTSTTAPTTGPDVGTTDEPGTTGSTGEPGTGTTGDDTTTGDAEELPPIESKEVLEAWLAGGAYKQWASESKVHASTGPHAGNVRTYVNALALGSLAAQTDHPQDASLVKELYGDSMDTLIGYAVMRKTAPDSQGGATWYWYERINANIFADGLGVGLCSGCHGGGADYILTPYPLQ